MPGGADARKKSGSVAKRQGVARAGENGVKQRQTATPQ
jgi:hypothetical protein